MLIPQVLANEHETVISFKGSVSNVSQFFYYAVNSIFSARCVQLLQCLIRAKTFFIHLVSLGIYPPGTFKRESKYGLTVLTSTDEGLTKYLDVT